MAEFQVLLREWESYYLLVGTAGATLAGLMFVAITFSSDMTDRHSLPVLRAHTDPALLAFVLCLALSLLLLMPSLNRGWCGTLLLLSGLLELVYMGLVLRRLVQGGQVRGWDVSDWCWYAAVPMVGGVLLLVSGGLCLDARATLAVTLIGLTLLVLLLMGVRNAWDMVTFTMARRIKKTGGSPEAVEDRSPGDTQD